MKYLREYKLQFKKKFKLKKERKTQIKIEGRPCRILLLV